MTAHESHAVPERDVVTTALTQAIVEIRKRKPAEDREKNDKEKDRPRTDPVLQLADELEDVLRRYVVETAIPSSTR